MKAISHFIRQFRCQLHQPGASAAAHTSPPAPQPQVRSPWGSALPRATLVPVGTRGASEGARGPLAPAHGQVAGNSAAQAGCARSQLSLAAGELELRAQSHSGWLCPSAQGSHPAPPGSPLLPFPTLSRSAPRGEGTGPGLGAWAWGSPGSCFFSQLSAAGVPQQSQRAHGHLGTQPASCHPGVSTWDVLRGPAVSPGSSSHAELPRPAPGTRPGWHPVPWGHSRALSHPRVDNVQMPARPGYESARTGVQQPLRDNRSCPGGCSGSQAVPVPNSVRAGGQVAGSSACLAPLPPPDQPRARQNPGLAFISLFAQLCFPGAKPWHGGTGPGPCLTLTRPRGEQPALPSCPPVPPATGMFHRASQSIPPGRACP